MQSSEVRQSRKALASLVGFLARGPATCEPTTAPLQPGKVELIHSDGAARKVDALVLKAALERGLIAVERSRLSSSQTAPSYRTTPEGRAALKRWLADPESAFQDQHRSLVTASDPDHGKLQVNLDESPLASLARIKGRAGELFLEPLQVEAGERLRIDFTRGQMQPSLGQSWEPVRMGRQSGQAGGAAEFTEAALSARMRVDAALAEVGPELSGVLLDVCCFLKGLAEVERERQWPARSAKLMLRTALSALARHYAAPRRKFREASRPSARPQHAP
ncbi:DUF6456 domain-containing protein [Hoeflea sp. AS60]|uniref:DUF6456 domain-containing protein n=1 Tax=Hoeflea sp. AS60 TaxID=3135780 RepID=UPI003178151B